LCNLNQIVIQMLQGLVLLENKYLRQIVIQSLQGQHSLNQWNQSYIPEVPHQIRQFFFGVIVVELEQADQSLH
jgi:hypothetical protein